MNTWVAQQIDAGYRRFLCGYEPGADLLFAEAVISHKIGRCGISLEAVLSDAALLDLDTTDMRFGRLLAGSDSAVVPPLGSPDCVRLRTRYMVDRADRVLALYDGRTEGRTHDAVQYARALNKDLHIIALPSLFISP